MTFCDTEVPCNVIRTGGSLTALRARSGRNGKRGPALAPPPGSNATDCQVSQHRQAQILGPWDPGSSLGRPRDGDRILLELGSVCWSFQLALNMPAQLVAWVGLACAGTDSVLQGVLDATLRPQFIPPSRTTRAGSLLGAVSRFLITIVVAVRSWLSEATSSLLAPRHSLNTHPSDPPAVPIAWEYTRLRYSRSKS